jgi:alpha-tubulin suppressor-like RCC1 family protein
VTALAASSSSNCALKSDGTVVCWGGNTPYGTLGSGSTTAQLTPVPVTGITTAKSVSLGPNHGCAGLSDGTLRCWGYNGFGQLGNGTTTDSLAPVQVTGLTTVASVGVANYTTCATLTDNTARCWGYGTLGSLGNGASKNSSVPVVVNAIP